MCQERPELRADIRLDGILDLDREWSDSQAKATGRCFEKP